MLDKRTRAPEVSRWRNGSSKTYVHVDGREVEMMTMKKRSRNSDCTEGNPCRDGMMDSGWETSLVVIRLYVRACVCVHNLSLSHQMYECWSYIFFFSFSSISLSLLFSRSLFGVPSGWLTPMIGPHEIVRERTNERTKKRRERAKTENILSFAFCLSQLPFEDVPCADDWRDSKMKRSNRYNLTCLMASTHKATTRYSIESLPISSWHLLR